MKLTANKDKPVASVLSVTDAKQFLSLYAFSEILRHVFEIVVAVIVLYHDFYFTLNPPSYILADFTRLSVKDK